MSNQGRVFTSPVGRLVGGDVFAGFDKDYDGRPLMTRDNKPRTEYVIVVAFPKSKPETGAMIQEIQMAAREGFPTLFANGQEPREFSWKIIDGDSAVPNQRGTVPNTKEGYPGNYVVTFKTSFPPDVFDADNVPIVDPKAIKRGYFVRVYATTRGNGQQSNPGVYVNHSLVQLCYFGEEISSGPDAATAFGPAPTELPAGASRSPLAPTGAIPGAHPTGAPGAHAAPTTPPPGQPAAAPAGGLPAFGGVAPAPAPGFGAPPPVAAAPPPPPPAAAPAPAGPRMAPGCPYTYEQLKAGGWSDEAMREQGHLL